MLNHLETRGTAGVFEAMIYLVNCLTNYRAFGHSLRTCTSPFLLVNNLRLWTHVTVLPGPEMVILSMRSIFCAMVSKRLAYVSATFWLKCWHVSRFSRVYQFS